MVSRTTTFAFDGIEARPVDVEVQLLGGHPQFIIVGLPDKTVAESRERVRAAFSAIGLALPPKRIIVNLAPADLPKEGSHYDLAIALALLVDIGAIPADALEGMAAIGELSLDSHLQPTFGALPAAIAAEALDLTLVCPESSGSEAAWAGGSVLAIQSLMAFINHTAGRAVISPPEAGAMKAAPPLPDLKDVKGQDGAKRALEIAAAGGHNLVFCGPPGSGKSMMATRMAGILPDLSPEELLEVSQIQSIAGMLERGELSRRRPYRAPHHSASMAALVGGGVKARPGEVSLAHHGVLFLDELPEFNSQVLEALRQPLESGEAVISRANRHVRYPARFQMIAAMNPCRCGGGPAEGNCRKKPKCLQDYQGRLSGPFLDRVDLFCDVPPVTVADLSLPTPAEGSKEVAARVARARQIQARRFADLDHDGRPLNVDLETRHLEDVCKTEPDGQKLLLQAAEQFSLSARAYHRVLKLARTIADLDEADIVLRRHLAEALTYRWRDPSFAPQMMAQS
ncbi:MAG: AAA family ATPase [Ponticaulis sp.]|nr:AAA family ATPase [Ponticaulis sp.]|tara:strand:+ start:77221 stop:78756 length:1536 start_codon:yes stop_codon:yes gene_type:complete